MNNIGNRLKLLRTSIGLTQDEVAEKLSLTRQAISSYETGRTQPDIDTLVKMAEIYNTDLQSVIYGNEAVIKHYEKIRCWARILLAVIVVLTFIGAGLQWTASRFFPIEEGGIIAESSIIEAHFSIISAGKTVDGFTFIMSFLGEFGLAIYAANHARHIPFKEKGVYALSLALFPFIICCIFGLSRYSLSLMNYVINPFFLAIQAGIMLLVNVLICKRINKKMN